MITAKIVKIITNNFDESEGVITKNTMPNDIDQWDSLGHVMLIQAIEESFDISFDLDELLELDSVQTIINAVEAKLK